MKRLLLLLATGMLFVSISCGGGGGTTLPPAERDLSGLEGTWTIAYTFSGTINTPEGPLQFADSVSGYLQITQNSVIGSDGPLVWSYNGTTLTIHNAVSLEDWSYDCGSILSSGEGQFKITISPGATFGNLSGTAHINIYTDYCGDASGDINYSGTISKN